MLRSPKPIILFGICSLLMLVHASASEPVFNITPATHGNDRIEKYKDGDVTAFAFSCAVDLFFSVTLDKALEKSFTVTAWFKPDGIPDRIGKFCVIGQGRDFQLSYTPDKRFEFEYKLADGKQETIKSQPLPSDQWYHIAVVCNGESLRTRIYVNTHLEHQSVISAAPAIPGLEFNIGCSDPKSDKPLWCNGLAGEIKLFGNALPHGVVKQLFESDSARYRAEPITSAVANERKGLNTLLPAFSADAVSEKRKQELKTEIPELVQKYRVEIAEYQKKLHRCLNNRDSFQKERIGKRMELVEQLVAFIDRNLQSASPDGLLFAASGAQDLKRFVDYFALEAECIDSFPWLPVKDDAGNDPKIFQIKDFGAKGDGVTDDYEAFRKAIEAMKELNGKPAILRISAGTYFFNSFAPADGTPAAKGGCHLRIKQLKNAVIEGDDPRTTKFIFGRVNAAGLYVEQCKNITVRNLMLQYQRNPFCQGTVLSVDASENTITIQHDPGTLTPDDPCFKENPRFQSCTAYTADGNIVRTQFLVYNEKKAEFLGGGKYKIHMDKRYTVRYVTPGLKFVIPNRIGEYPCFPIGNSVLCTMENVHIRNSPASAFQTWGGFWNSWTKCQLYPLPGMYLASNADFLITGNGSYLSNSTVKNPGDDCFNVFVGGKDILDAEGNIAVYPGMPGHSVPGNMLTFISGTTGQTLALGIIQSSSGNGGNTQAVLTEALPDTIVSRKKGGLKKLTQTQEDLVSRHLIRYDNRRDAVYDRNQWGIGSVASGNYFAHARAGINIQSPVSLVENNVFENIPMGVGIAISCLLGVHEGPAPYCVTIRDNKVNDTWAAVRIFALVQNMEEAQCAPIHGLLFENNLWTNSVQLILKNLSDTTFRNNKFTGATAVNQFGEKGSRIFVENSAAVTFQGNTYLERPLQPGDLLRKGCAENGVAVK